MEAAAGPAVPGEPAVASTTATAAAAAEDAAQPPPPPQDGRAGLWSVVIPTYNRLPILRKCLAALERQGCAATAGVNSYEVVVVDDGSEDGTVEHLEANAVEYSHVRLLRQAHAGATAARNLGVASMLQPIRHLLMGHLRLAVRAWAYGFICSGALHLMAAASGLLEARGATIVFIDSDLVVTPTFLCSHARALQSAYERDGDDRAFTYGRVVNTSNFEDPTAEPYKLTDLSAAFFATGNIAISKRRLLMAGALLGPGSQGPFDADFSEYGWEDLELGVRLKKQGARIQPCPAAVGYHWHPAFSVDQLPKLIEQERQRGRNGLRFYRKHPTLDVRLMIQMTPLHEGLWALLTLGGLLNEESLRPTLDALVQAGRPGLAAALLSPVLNWHTVQALKAELRGF
eukprot:SM000083S22789  [mRNA]  locus=s83:450680:453198:- [translate_table: standard]